LPLWLRYDLIQKRPSAWRKIKIGDCLLLHSPNARNADFSFNLRPKMGSQMVYELIENDTGAAIASLPQQIQVAIRCVLEHVAN
jgi:hypothetical protein